MSENCRPVGGGDSHCSYLLALVVVSWWTTACTLYSSDWTDSKHNRWCELQNVFRHCNFLLFFL